jgi:SPP1 family predicted phage head-tail adaptor
MRAGTLRNRVILQRPIEIRGADYADSQRTWQDVATVSAAVEPLSAREFFQNLEVQGELSARIRIRYMAGVSAKWRVLFGSRIFEIQGVINPGEMNVELELLCAESASG